MLNLEENELKDFEIPFFFKNKYPIFKKLFLEKELTFEKYLENEPERVSFIPNNYGEIFIKNNENLKDVAKEINSVKIKLETESDEIDTSNIELSD